jgi:hypothetical protein
LIAWLLGCLGIGAAIGVLTLESPRVRQWGDGGHGRSADWVGAWAILWPILLVRLIRDWWRHRL